MAFLLSLDPVAPVICCMRSHSFTRRRNAKAPTEFEAGRGKVRLVRSPRGALRPAWEAHDASAEGALAKKFAGVPPTRFLIQIPQRDASTAQQPQ